MNGTLPSSLKVRDYSVVERVTHDMGRAGVEMAANAMGLPHAAFACRDDPPPDHPTLAGAAAWFRRSAPAGVSL